MSDPQIQFPEYFMPFLNSVASGNWAMHNFFKGGRAGGKSHSIALLLLMMAREKKLRIVCARELQGSMEQSVHSMLDDLIKAHGLHEEFKVTAYEISHNTTGSQFYFRGLYRNVASLKSIPNIDVLWIEEAANVSAHSLKELLPTIRTANPLCIYTYNPQKPTDPIEAMALLPEIKDVSYHLHVNIDDNPFATESIKGQRDMAKAQAMRTGDWSQYNHTWLGEYLTQSDAMIFNNRYEIREFEYPYDHPPSIGIDWGFANDPQTCIRTFFDKTEKILYISDEVYWDKPLTKKDYYADFERDVAKYIPYYKAAPIVADSARPEHVEHYRRKYGWARIRSATKGPGSVMSGIQWLQSLNKIVIHPRCKATAKEFSLYSYRIDRVTGEILDEPEDANNHCIDAIRYACEEYRTKASVSTFKRR